MRKPGRFSVGGHRSKADEGFGSLQPCLAPSRRRLRSRPVARVLVLHNGLAGDGRTMTREVIEGEGCRLRRAELEDADYLTKLAANEDVYPFLAAISPWRAEVLTAEIQRSIETPNEVGRLVIEVEEDGDWRPVGAAAFEVANQRSRIASLYGIMVDPEHRGRGLGESAVRALGLHLLQTAGYHRVQLEVYGFNERGLRLFERAGFVLEGRKRKAYWRRDQWNDGVLFGLVREDLGLPEDDPVNWPGSFDR